MNIHNNNILKEILYRCSQMGTWDCEGPLMMLNTNCKITIVEVWKEIVSKKWGNTMKIYSINILAIFYNSCCYFNGRYCISFSSSYWMSIFSFRISSTNNNKKVSVKFTKVKTVCKKTVEELLKWFLFRNIIFLF